MMTALLKAMLNKSFSNSHKRTNYRLKRLDTTSFEPTNQSTQSL